jgi:hypothetical protein
LKNLAVRDRKNIAENAEIISDKSATSYIA